LVTVISGQRKSEGREIARVMVFSSRWVTLDAATVGKRYFSVGGSISVDPRRRVTCWKRVVRRAVHNVICQVDDSRSRKIASAGQLSRFRSRIES
jgi:hypothetical protein